MEFRLSKKAVELLNNQPLTKTKAIKNCISKVRTVSNAKIFPPYIVDELRKHIEEYKRSSERVRTKYSCVGDAEAQGTYDFAKLIAATYRTSISSFVDFCIVRGLTENEKKF